MSGKLYVRLAWTGIQKNKQLYLPYLVAGATMVMVFYIIDFLSVSDMVNHLHGGMAMTSILICGAWLIGVFSLPFLFYTNSALLKKRKREFGLYNILGMNKRNILMVLFLETFMTYGIVTVTGICMGILFSKIAELGLVNIMEQETDYHIYIEWRVVLVTVLLYAAVYFLIFLNAMRQLRNNNPIELLKSEAAGERPPKSRWLLVILGVMFTASGYVTAIQIGNAQEVVNLGTFCAVAVIGGTYFLFIAGSVSLCKLLQKNKKYYYKTAHFVTTSSLSYRMKRNGASLATICILSTMILVVLAGAVGLYAGTDSIIEKQYPYDFSLTVEEEKDWKSGDGGKVYGNIWNMCKEEMEDIMVQEGVEADAVLEGDFAVLCADLQKGVLDLSVDIMGKAPAKEGPEWNTYLQGFVMVRVMSLTDYNRMTQSEEKLGDREVFIAGGKSAKSVESVRSFDESEYTVVKTQESVPRFFGHQIYKQHPETMADSFLLVVQDMNLFWENFDASLWSNKNQVDFFREYDIELSEEFERQLAIGKAVEERLEKIKETVGNQTLAYSVRAEKAADLKGLSGGLMFLAIVISAVFVFVAALIMYYKQISEGYEDQRQFSIMRKLGMTKREIKRSIHSQMLTVFCFPLAFAGVHLVFALPAIYQLMRGFILDDKPLLIKTTAVSYLLFAVVYSLVYLLTTRAYYNIVNRPVNEAL